MGNLNLSAWVERHTQIETPHEQHILRGIKAYEDEIERLYAGLDKRTRQALDMCAIASNNVDDLIESRAETDKAAAEIERLRKALSPFGRAVYYSNELNGINQVSACRPHDMVTIAEFRAARAALQENL